MVDIIDVKNKKLVWRGAYEYKIRYGITAEEQELIIHEAVLEILSQFPPK